MSDIKVGDVWKHKIDNNYYVRIIEVDDKYVVIFRESGENSIAKIEHFLVFYSFHKSADPVIAVAPDMSVAIGDVWQARCDGTTCQVMDIEVDDGVTWVTTQSVEDEYAVESDTLRDFFEGYRFVGRGTVNQDVKHGHYHKDVSKYKTMDIYAICKVWSAEPSGCTHHALKKLLHAGERGAKSKITDLEQAIESIEALIKLEKMDIRGDS